MHPGVNILVVDDEEIMRNLFTDILHDEGHQVTTVCNGKEAQPKVQNSFFDIAFVDVNMPVMDGIKTLKMLREASPDTNIVMMDSLPQYALDEFIKEGAVSCIHKPFNITEVRAVVSKIIKKGKHDGQ